MRYEALLGPNTKQLWLYDTENDTYIDPPTSVLTEADKIMCVGGEMTTDSISAAEGYLERVANSAPEPDWLHDGNEYPADELDP